MSLTMAQVVRDVASDWGRTVTDDEVSLILWEYTGFPCFWDGDPVTVCARQVDEFFARGTT